MPPMSTDFRKRYQPHRANNLRRLRAAISCTDDIAKHPRGTSRRCKTPMTHAGTLPKYVVLALSAAEGFGDEFEPASSRYRPLRRHSDAHCPISLGIPAGRVVAAEWRRSVRRGDLVGVAPNGREGKQSPLQHK